MSIMSFFKKYKKKFVAKLRQLRKYYRYKVYFPKKYESYCNQPVQENKVLFLEMRFTTLSNSFQYLYKKLEESGEYDLKCSYVQFNFIRGREFTQRVNEMLKELATAKYVFVDDASLILSSIPLRKETVAINLWHACGAFKKFGQRGTNLSLPEDRATHAQYNLVCVSGDGSIQMNLQELQTIVHHKLPIKLFVINNNGYQSIRITQRSFF